MVLPYYGRSACTEMGLMQLMKNNSVTALLCLPCLLCLPGPLHIMNGHIAASVMCCSSCSCCNSCCSWIGPAQDSVVLDTLEYGLSLVCMYGSMYEVGECSR